jgi:hypothetical protein
MLLLQIPLALYGILDLSDFLNTALIVTLGSFTMLGVRRGLQILQ